MNKTVLSLLALLIIILGNYFLQEDFKAFLISDISSVLESSSVTTNSDFYKVIKVVDGDTIDLETGDTVRLIGIDTPEVYFGAECYGNEASEFMKNLLEGKYVTLEKDVSETDKYGRLLRYVYLEGDSINETLVKEGYAFSSAYPPDIKYQDKLDSLEQLARNSNLGLWEECYE
jgi:micrococcal nuclease